MTEEGLVGGAERRGRAGLAAATAYAGRARVRAVIARANATTVEVPSTVGHGGCPLSDDRPEVGAERCEFARIAARRLNVLLVGP